MAIFLIAWSVVSVLIAAVAVGSFVRERTRANARRAIGFVVFALAVLVLTALWFQA